jgi:hypothetical protein
VCIERNEPQRDSKETSDSPTPNEIERLDLPCIERVKPVLRPCEHESIAESNRYGRVRDVRSSERVPPQYGRAKRP